jgi:hypothetical protein
MANATTWKDAVRGVVRALPREFTLPQVITYSGELQRLFPKNRFVEAKVRQSLQILLAQGLLQRIERGRYRRLDVSPRFSPLIDFTITKRFRSSSQVARVALETWAAFNLYCLHCERVELDRLPHNTPVADFECFACGTRYQLKTKNGRFGPRVSGAKYGVTIEAVRSGTMPDHIFVEYDRRFSTVVFVDAVPGKSITPDRIVARRPLRSTARRAGWQGCSIVIADLPYARMVAPAGIDRRKVLEKWRSL